MTDKKEVLDLDDLVPKKCVIKFEGKEIEISPPKTGDFMYLAQLASKMGETEKMEPDAINALVLSIEAQIGKLVPELVDKHFSNAQLTSLMNIITEMAMPADAKELDRRGITPNTDEAPKKD